MAATSCSLVVCLALALGPSALDAAQFEASKRGCGRLSSTLRHTNPGAGMNPGELAPFKESFMDGYMMVGCVKDDMHEHGDKHGDGKVSYKLGDVSGVSIVHYTETVAKMDQEQMTHEVCFGFCRTVPEMMFFGITNGRDCYCAPYYNQVAGDSSECDAVCDGNPTTMCGGKTKSSVFEMHACNDHAENLAAANSGAEEGRLALKEQAGFVTESSGKMQDAANALQDAFGKVGDAAATAQAQAAKVFAGKLEHAAEAGTKIVGEVEALESEAATHEGPVESAEKLTAQLLAATDEAKGSTESLQKLQGLAAGNPDASSDSAKLYYPVMYFVDKEHVEAPATCGGKSAAEPIVGSFDSCAAACEATAGKCVGFSYLTLGEDGICSLLSEVTTATYYTGCKQEKKEKMLFLQKAPGAEGGTKCVVKFANFEGTTLKPNPSGKCKACLKEAKQADRCFQ